MDSGDSLIIPVNSFQGSNGDAQSNRLISEHQQMENAAMPRGEHDALIESVKVELEMINNPAINVSHLPMLRVPDLIKQLNPNVYKPRFISIGPVHHGQPGLLPMETFKRRYTRDFMQRKSINIETMIQVTKNHLLDLRNSYGIPCEEIPDDKFVKIMIIDAAFLMEFLFRDQNSGSYNGKWSNVYSDFFLLENQIPLAYLSYLFLWEQVASLLDRFIDNSKLFSVVGGRGMGFQEEKHLLDRLRTRMAYSTNDKSPSSSYNHCCPTILQLHRAGIKLRPTLSYHEISFEERTLTLRIPHLALDHNTGRYFANLLTSEWFAVDRYASDYIAVMDYFIDGPEDVRILVERGILVNHLQDDKAAANFINEIGRSVNMSPDFRYKWLVEKLDAHCKKAWVTWKSRYLFDWARDLKANYFASPWKALSVIAAVILLGLTVTQTVFSYLQLKGQ